MTDTLKAGDTVWTIDGEWICNFDDDYYAIKIPTHVRSHTVKEYKKHDESTPTRYKIRTTDDRYYENCEYKTEYYLTADEAFKTLQKERKQFLINYPNNWQKIIDELQQLLNGE